MLHPIARSKAFVKNHRTQLVYGAGVVTGVAFTALAAKRISTLDLEIPLNVTGEQLKAIIDTSQGKGFNMTNPRSGAVTIISTLDAFQE